MRSNLDLFLKWVDKELIYMEQLSKEWNLPTQAFIQFYKWDIIFRNTKTGKTQTQKMPFLETVRNSLDVAQMGIGNGQNVGGNWTITRSQTRERITTDVKLKCFRTPLNIMIHPFILMLEGFYVSENIPDNNVHCLLRSFLLITKQKDSYPNNVKYIASAHFQIVINDSTDV